MDAPPTEPADLPSEDIIKILVATDIHLGHLENDPIRGDDSFIAFEEVLSTAVECEVDMILLGGDLFDHSKPSPGCMLRATALLRQYCLGDKAVALELLSDQQEAFGRCVNYQDPNLNVSYPVMSIHGNHDDPVGQGAVSSLDILSSMGLVNYFGRWTDYSQVSIAPILLRKGETQLALYGLSHLKDQRLARLFKEGKVEMQRPAEEQGEWFNLLVLHQNRADRGPFNYIQEEVLPEFLDLVVWGHEHDVRVREEQNATRNFFVTQPGSTVATSLAAGEALPKHCALLQLNRKKFILTPIPLKTVRPFIFKTIVLSEEALGEPALQEHDKVQEFLTQQVHAAVEEAARRRSGHPRQPALPLVRLSVFFERDSQDFNRMRFGQNFSGLVANPADLLLMKREKRVRERKPRCDGDSADMDGADVDGGLQAGEAARAPDVEALLHAYFAALGPARQPALLSAAAMTDAVRDFTCKRDTDAFHGVLRAQRRRALDALAAAAADTEEQVAETLRTMRLELEQAEPDARRRLLAAAAAKPTPPSPVVTLTPIKPGLTIKKSVAVKPEGKASRRTVVVLSSDEEESAGATPGRGRGRGRGAATPRGRGGRGKAAAVAPDSPPSERRVNPRRSAARKSASWLQNIITDRAGNIDEDSD